MTALDCAGAREIAPDLAVGLADGDERAAVLEHVAHCEPCREELDRLAATVDAVLLAAPSIEPPEGFAARVIDALDGVASPPATPADAAAAASAPVPLRPRRSRRARALVVAVAVASAAAVIAAVLAVVPRDPSPPEAASVGAGLRALGGETLRVGPLTTTDGRAAGQVFAYQGRPSWLMVTLTDAVAPGTYAVECEYEVGESFTAGTVAVDGGPAPAVWSTAVPVPLDELTRVRLVPVGAAPGTPPVVEAEVAPA